MMLNGGVEQSLIAIKRLLKCNRKTTELKKNIQKQQLCDNYTCPHCECLLLLVNNPFLILFFFFIVSGMLEFNLFGIPYVSTDLCPRFVVMITFHSIRKHLSGIQNIEESLREIFRYASCHHNNITNASTCLIFSATHMRFKIIIWQCT